MMEYTAKVQAEEARELEWQSVCSAWRDDGLSEDVYSIFIGFHRSFNEKRVN